MGGRWVTYCAGHANPAMDVAPCCSRTYMISYADDTQALGQPPQCLGPEVIYGGMVMPLSLP